MESEPDRVEYWKLDVFSDLFLQDSFLLNIQERENHIFFDMEFVLIEGHPDYSPPKNSEQYCYRRGQIVFRDCKSVTWLERHDVVSIDASGESDLDNIDVFYLDKDGYHLMGSWGSVVIASSAPVVNLDDL